MKKGRRDFTWSAHPLRDKSIGKRKPTPPKKRRSAKALASAKGTTE